MSGAPTPAVRELERLGLTFELHAYAHDPSSRDFGDEAVRELGLDASLVCKTLIVAVDEVLTVAVLPVNMQLNLKAHALACGGKRATLATPQIASKRTGYVVGGISPLGQRSRLTTVIDVSVQGAPRVYVSGGRRGLEIALAAEDLARSTEARWASIAK